MSPQIQENEPFQFRKILKIFRLNYPVSNIQALALLSLFAITLTSLFVYKHSVDLRTRAQTMTTMATAFEPENGTANGPVAVITGDPTASNNSYVQFNQSLTGFQPTAPYYTTFYYPWYKTPTIDGSWSYWQDNGHTPSNNWFSNYLPDYDTTQFNPSTELYSSKDDAVIYWQLRKLMEAKQEVGISSWWGQGHKTDTSFAHIITDVMNRPDNPYPNFRWTNYYEKEGDNGQGQPNDPSIAQIVNDLNYIYTHYASQPAYFKINGRPVIFVYADANDCTAANPCDSTNTNSMVYRWYQAKQQAQGNFYVVLKVFSGYATAPFQPDNWHQYAPAGRSGQHANHAYYVSPGFWKNGEASPRLARDLSTFQTAIQNMVNANTTFKIVETWNEWGEGSSVEPGDQAIQTTSGNATLDPNGVPFKNRYIDVLHQLLPPLEGSAVSPTAAPSIAPTSTPIPNPTTTPFILAAAGDIACNSNVASSSGCLQQATSDLIAQVNPQAVLALGDTQYETGAYADFMQYYHPTWGRFKAITYPVPGNHEFGTSGGSGYYQYFYDGTNPAVVQNDTQRKGYYSADLTNNWHMVAINLDPCINNNTTECNAEITWLQSDLQRHPTQCTLAQFHESYYTSGTRGPELAGRPFVQVLYDNNADVILSAHQHFYERFAPQTPDNVRDDVRGLRSFTVGTGGKDSPTLGQTTYPNLVIRKAPAFGILKLELTSNGYSWQFISVPGQTFTDSGSANCH